MRKEFFTPGKDAPGEEAVLGMLSLVTRGAGAAAVASWTQIELMVAYDWAAREHLHASDNKGFRRHPMPSFVAAALEEPVLPDREHVVRVGPQAAARLRAWLASPNRSLGGEGFERIRVEAVDGGGLLVRTMPYQASGTDVRDEVREQVKAQLQAKDDSKPRLRVLEELRKHGADGMTLQEACDAFPAWDREDILHRLRLLLLLGRVARGTREGIETVTWRVSEDQAQKPLPAHNQVIAILRGAGSDGITWEEARELMPEMHRATTSSILHRLRDEEIAEAVETDGEVRRWRIAEREADERDWHEEDRYLHEVMHAGLRPASESAEPRSPRDVIVAMLQEAGADGISFADFSDRPGALSREAASPVLRALEIEGTVEYYSAATGRWRLAIQEGEQEK
ncbi:MAG: hypothetical protein JWM19_904 [Actinomycetia bacterium]|nr:hypothetical protein [Actinomycetes bacterium]